MSGKVKTWAEELEEKGLERGRIETIRESIITLVLKRFPEASQKEAREKLNTLNTPTKLQFILNRAFDWKSYEDVWTLQEDSDS